MIIVVTVCEHGRQVLLTVDGGSLPHTKSASSWPWTPQTWEQCKAKSHHSFKTGEKQKLRGEKYHQEASIFWSLPFQCFKIFNVEVYGFLVGFIPRCTFFEATMNGIVFLVSCLACSRMVYGKAMGILANWFCILFLCSKCVLVLRVESWGSLKHKITSSATRDTLISSFAVCIPFSLFPCLSAPAEISGTTLSKMEMGDTHPCSGF